jgi:hypothetical protein
MPSIRVAVLLRAWLALTVGGMAWGGAGEQRWTQYWGQIHAIAIDRCGQHPGFCEGTLVKPRHNSRYVFGSLSRPCRLIVTPQHSGRCLVHIESLILPLYSPEGSSS